VEVDVDRLTGHSRFCRQGLQSDDMVAALFE